MPESEKVFLLAGVSLGHEWERGVGEDGRYGLEVGALEGGEEVGYVDYQRGLRDHVRFVGGFFAGVGV